MAQCRGEVVTAPDSCHDRIEIMSYLRELLNGFLTVFGLILVIVAILGLILKGVL